MGASVVFFSFSLISLHVVEGLDGPGYFPPAHKYSFSFPLAGPCNKSSYGGFGIWAAVASGSGAEISSCADGVGGSGGEAGRGEREGESVCVCGKEGRE